ncbi:hypothetical protein DENIS_1140 [Desulfonema ishimotonii]|uniref:Type II secretion system protein H n=1 Tax=Desulfonema ishimotonii TaxID=45657 RepID=A0A401FT98_9BACT|nr:GspH/FimT family pseudopilin [Desulfonema ishimotonii]GBC60189.1 hypothetical protein DENIS_1140 [Desulfonema ishimotonii]
MIRFSGGRGFTLLELMVVMVIVGLMSVLIVPRLGKSLSRLGAETAARKVVASLRYARSIAVSERKIWLADFDFEAGRIILKPWRRETDSDAGEPETVRERLRTFTLPDGVRLEKGISVRGDVSQDDFQIAFFPGGGSGGGEVFLGDDHGRRFHLEADIITGAIRLAEAEAREN